MCSQKVFEYFISTSVFSRALFFLNQLGTDLYFEIFVTLSSKNRSVLSIIYVFRSMLFRNSSENCKTLFWQKAQDGIVLGDHELVRAGAGNLGEGE